MNQLFLTDPRTLLELIKGKILELPLKQFRKDMLLEDINLAIQCFDQGNMQCVINNLNVLVAKLNSKIFLCVCDKVKPLLADILILIQKITSGEGGGNFCPCPCPPTGNLIVNGDFEASATSLVGWTAINAEPLARDGSPVSDFFEGNVVAELGRPRVSDNASISQSFSVNPGCPYRFSFAAQSNPAGPELFVTVTCDGHTLIDRQLTTLGSGYNTYSYLLTIPSDCTQATVTFTKTRAGVAFIDLVTFGSD